MKSIWIAIIALGGLLLIGVASVAGTVTYTNDTNAVATGLEVEFSAPATITWHSGQFAEQDPSGFAAKFTFSGGSVKPGDTFMISWGPDAVKVVDHTWVSEGSETAASGTLVPGSDSSADDSSGNTTTAPAPEQVKPAQPWTLTDEYGNTDIMDDDDIVLHLGVPASQVEKIVWKRNGITMRFIDPKDKVTVLTNDLMKIFDGNYREHSPASAHTDHAIAGYEYSALVYLADGNLKAFKTTIESTFRWRPKEVWAEMDGAWIMSYNRLSYTDIVIFFQELKSDGFTGVSFDMPYYMDSPNNNSLFELRKIDHSVSQWNILTPTFSQIETFLKAAQEANMDVHVRGNIYISQVYQKEHGFSWSSQIDPTNPRKFFDSYAALWLKLVPLLNKYHVKLLTPFTEMDGIEKYPDLINKMYTMISAQFEGEMGFEEATNIMLEGVSPMQNGRSFLQMVKNFTFWDWKDSKGRPMRIEYSGWNPPVETQKDQRVSVMEHNFVKFWKPAVDYYRSTYPEDPQMFGEIGARNADGQSLGPSYWSITNKVEDEQEQVDYLYASFEGTKRLGVNAINLWTIPLGDLWDNDVPGMTFINIGLRQPKTPAYRVIKAIIKPSDE